MQIALRIALIKEEFSEKEILEAVKFLEEQETSSALLAYLAGRETMKGTPRVSRRAKKAIHEQRSRAVIALEKTEPEKYRVLSEFDSLLRRKEILPNLGDIRQLGERLSKDFSARNSRRDLISKLMKLLSERPIEEVREVVENTISSSHPRDSGYQQLADFIITGGTTKDTTE